jgi:predicted transcriptional regulator
MSTNITLRLDEKTLRRIRHLAVDRHTSVSAWVGELVTRAVEELDGFEPARKRALRDMAHPVPVPSAAPLGREQVHER